MARRTKEAFLWVVKILKKHKIPFEIGGGLAARAYGTKRRLADIDIDLNEKGYKKIIKVIKPYIIFGPKFYKDKNWKLNLITLKYKGQKIDLAGIIHTKIFNSNKKKWIILKSHLTHAHLKKIYGINVPIEDKKELISYKKKLDREVDKIDIKQLSKNN